MIAGKVARTPPPRLILNTRTEDWADGAGPYTGREQAGKGGGPPSARPSCRAPFPTPTFILGSRMIVHAVASAWSPRVPHRQAGPITRPKPLRRCVNHRRATLES